jgi:hypothetical protein
MPALPPQGHPGVTPWTLAISLSEDALVELLATLALVGWGVLATVRHAQPHGHPLWQLWLCPP